MKYTTRLRSITKYEYAGCNQHGQRFKVEEYTNIKATEMRCKCDNVKDMRCLIVLSSQLSVPLKYAFETDEAYIEVVSIDCVT